VEPDASATGPGQDFAAGFNVAWETDPSV